MPRYYFHLVNGTEVFDPLGVLLVNDAAAHIHAENLAAECANSTAGLRVRGIRVTDALGAVLFRLNVHR